MKTTETIPARAAWAATELARLPVDAQAATLKPSWRALVSATETTRSLNEPVGLAVSFLIHSSPRPSSAARRSARTSGVQPVPRSIGLGVGHRQQGRVAPDGRRTGLDLVPGDRRPQGLVVVDDLEGPEAVVTDVQRFGWVGPRAFPAAQPGDEIHAHPPHRSGIGTWRPVGWRGVLVAAASQGPSLSRSG